jgi:hypothetical protein
MTQKNPALKLFRDLVDDLSDPNFVWQVVALAACVGPGCSPAGGGRAITRRTAGACMLPERDWLFR